MEIADERGRASVGARKSLRAFKASPQYKTLLEGLVAKRETATMTSLERRRLRLDRILASLELEKLKRGEALSEFAGIMSLYDPAKGLIEVEE